MSALGSKMRSVRPFVQPPSNPRPGPSGQPRPPNPWTGWTPWTSNTILQGLGDRHGILRGLGPVRGSPLIAMPETAAVILGRSRATLTYRRRNTLAPGLIGDSTDGGGVEP